MTSITLETLLTHLYVLVDDWYQAEGQTLMRGKVGAKAHFSDSEMLTLMLAQDFIPYPSERQYLAFIRAHYLALFPQLVDQSQYNRRARGLVWLTEPLRRAGLRQLGVRQPDYLLVDTKPVPAMGMKRSKRHSAFRAKADYGYCAARQMHYFGYKLVLLTTLDGLPLVYDLVPASTDERLAAETVLERVTNATILGDKGFVGEAWQAEMLARTGNRIYTPKRTNQKAQNPPQFDRLLNAVRERIEGVFHSLQNTGRNLERLLAKQERGLHVRVAAKIASFVFRHVLNRCFGLDILSFSISH
ncbi:MAG: IS982 family transposase [bacterium]|nr:IS982 family transposase [bacterium]